MHLLPHPAYPHPMLTTVEAMPEFALSGDLCLHYALSAALAEFNIPRWRSSAQADELWKHSCFEVFIAVAGRRDYLEYNFSPSGEWAVYAFSDYRLRSAWQSSQIPHIEITQGVEHLTVTARLSVEDLPFNPDALPFQVGLTAVLEAHDGSLSYWALHHPSEHPDFHHREGFKARLMPANLS